MIKRIWKDLGIGIDESMAGAGLMIVAASLWPIYPPLSGILIGLAMIGAAAVRARVE